MALYLGGAAERVLRSLDVKISGGQPAVDGRFVFEDKLELAPAGPMSLLRTGALSFSGKLALGKLLGRLPKLDAARYAGVTVDEWVADSVNGERAADVVHALVRLSTYVNEPTQLSAEVAVSQLQMALAKGCCISITVGNHWSTSCGPHRASLSKRARPSTSCPTRRQ